ncbi:NAD(P)-dependent oxidoreductase [Herbiconiux sp. KACC 21604]|uniref:NAD-dependent epimerase/dehydratase family protein n=1 Tax=unclassified Herbiconiux TaxID=2618217 RepID=UPI001490CABA|nr:NAD(P)-dependent oxidoreductase [Herbiconiux sp. SALV-R1]QJU55699.1 NAD(P)-dependent oxidoreductase [Herbiconiux sp. SALV-R1]WPO86903.1 NAD(P)-dependent oxidoreductase [Herbiconiux sp. KACC 21604]
MSRIIVTGGSGRLGRSVVAVLAEAGHEVFSLDRAPVEGLPAEQVVVDLAEEGAAAECFERIRPDGVVHLAAVAVPFSEPDRATFATNTDLAWTVLEASLSVGAASLLIASSPTVIGYGSPTGWKPAYLPIDEQHPRAPWNSYALSKLAVEELVAMAARRDGDRLRIGAFRPCYVIAPEEWEGAQTQQGHTVRERLDDPALSAVALFNYVDARDAGDFVRLWLEQAATLPNGTTFFVGAHDSLVTAPLPDALAQHVPAAGGYAIAADGAVFSSHLAEELLGWRARRSWRTELHTPEHSAAPSPRTISEVEHA